MMVNPVELLRHIDIPLTKTSLLTLLLVERLHHAHAGDGIRQHVADPRPLAPGAKEQPTDPLAVQVNRPTEKRDGRRHHEPQLPVEAHEHRR